MGFFGGPLSRVHSVLRSRNPSTNPLIRIPPSTFPSHQTSSKSYDSNFFRRNWLDCYMKAFSNHEIPLHAFWSKETSNCRYLCCHWCGGRNNQKLLQRSLSSCIEDNSKLVCQRRGYQEPLQPLNCRTKNTGRREIYREDSEFWIVFFEALLLNCISLFNTAVLKRLLFFSFIVLLLLFS